MNKTVLITGCSSGFGRDLVPALLNQGWKVFAGMRRISERAKIFEEEKKKWPDLLELVELDITVPADRAHMAARLAGRLDCLVNNAGIGVYGAFEDISESQIRCQMETNFFGTLALTQELLPALRNSRGRVINISSVLGFAGIPLSSIYCASKFALEGWSEALRFELLAHGVQIALIESGSFETQFIKNVEWGERSQDVGSPYFNQTQCYERYRSQRRRPASSQVVIDSILSAAQCQRVPLRIRCGSEPRIFYWVKKILPIWAQEFMLSRIYRKMYGLNAIQSNE